MVWRSHSPFLAPRLGITEVSISWRDWRGQCVRWATPGTGLGIGHCGKQGGIMFRPPAAHRLS
eukprot:11856597-Alexandrium_andersonii.AAC.1